MQEEFISTLSHEIRTPLTSIKGFSQTLLGSWDKISDDKKKEFLKIILNQSQRLINLCENVLDVAKLNTDEQKLVFKKVDLIKTLENSINTIKANYPDFKFEIKNSSDELFSYVDSDKTTQIIINLLDNALKYSNNSDKIEIKTGIKDNFNFISIKNFGSYIDKKDEEKIFEKFYRIDSYLKTKTQGSGLGLYIVKTLVEKMNGYIELNSNKETLETEFKVFLPYWKAGAFV